MSSSNNRPNSYGVEFGRLSPSLAPASSKPTQQQKARGHGNSSCFCHVCTSNASPASGLLPKPDWRRRIEQFQTGEWFTLLQETTPAPEDGNPAPAPTRPDLQRRAQRARHLVQMGELSAARQALTAAPTAPATHSTLEELRDPARRPPEPYQHLSPEVSNFQPDQPIQLPAPQPPEIQTRSTSDTLRLVLDDEEATQRLTAVAQSLARADVPPSIIPCLGLGRMVALQKPNGRARGIIIGDVLRRLVSRSLAQTYAEAIHTACSPHQFALSTRAGTKAIIHTITAAAQANPAHTIVSVDGIGAYDTISRESMLQGLMAVPAAQSQPAFRAGVLWPAFGIRVARRPRPRPHHHPSRRGGTSGPLYAGIVFPWPKRRPASHPTPTPPHRIAIGFPG